jgi:hypothetical protein
MLSHLIGGLKIIYMTETLLSPPFLACANIPSEEEEEEEEERRSLGNLKKAR